MESRRAYQIVAVGLLLIVVSIVVVRLQREETTPGDPLVEDQSARSSQDRKAPSRDRQSSVHRDADRQLGIEGAATDMSLAEFPRKAYQRKPSPAGKASGSPEGEVYIHVPSSGRRVAMDANQIGEYPAINTKTNDTVGVRLMLDEVKSGTPVRVVIMDGGTFPSEEGVSRLMKVADWRGVAFEYTTSSNVGTHRILVEASGHPKRIIDFNAFDSSDS